MKKIFTVLLTLAFVSISIISVTSTSGPGGGYTNAPGEGNCTSCHSGSLNSGGALSNLLLDGNFTGNGYIPDSSYTITISMTQSGRSKFGFNVTALAASNNSPAGDVTITNSSRTQKRTASVSGQTRQYVEHTSGGTSATKTNGIDWEYKWTAPSSNVGDIKFYVTCNATNSNGGTSGDYIYAKTFNIAPSTLLPTVEAVASDTIVCAGTPVDFSTKKTGNPTTYSWLFPNGSPSISSDSTPQVSYNFQGNQKAMVRVKNNKGWSGYDTINIQVLQSPTAFIQGAATRNVCKGGSIELVANFNPTWTYKWSNGATGNKATITTPGTYFVTVKSSTCEKVSNSITVSYFNDTKATLTSNQTGDSVCQNDVVRLTATSGYDSFFWYRNDQLIAGSDTNLLDVNVDSNWHYSVRVKDNNGCIGSNSDSIQFTHVPRVPAPTVQCSDRTPFSLEYDWTGLQSHNGAQVSINGGATWITPSSGKTGNSHSMTGLIPEKDYELWVRGVTKSPCFYTEVAKQVCRTGACSPLKAVVVADSQICDGEELRVEVNGLANERFSLSFEGGSAFTDTVFTFSPLVEKSYLIEVTDSNALGCPAKELTFPVHIDKIGLLNFQTQKPSNYFCQDDTIEFRASPGNDVYSFYVNNTLRTSSSDSFYYEDQFKDGDSAFVAVEKGVCMDTSEVIYLNLVPTPNAKFSYDSSGSLYTFTPEITAHSSYLWDFGDGFTSVLTSPDHSYKTSSNQTVVVKLEVEDNSGCLAEAEQTLNLPDFSSIHSLGQGLMKVYPSPVQDVLTIELSNIHTGMNILISDLNGSTVLTAKSDQLITQLDLSSVASGIYLLTIEAEGHAVTQRLMVR